jgi:hypothetical protein
MQAYHVWKLSLPLVVLLQQQQLLLQRLLRRLWVQPQERYSANKRQLHIWSTRTKTGGCSVDSDAPQQIHQNPMQQ